MTLNFFQIILVTILSGIRAADHYSTQAFTFQHALWCWLTGIVLGTALKTWPRVMRGAYEYLALAACLVLVLWFRVNAAWTLVGGMLCGIALELARPRADGAAPPPGEDRPWRGLWPGVLFAAACAAAAPAIFATFAKFGLLCFGGGNVLVPVYFDAFVGPEAPLLQLPAEDFNNLLAVLRRADILAAPPDEGGDG